jgi:hypothetical protein
VVCLHDGNLRGQYGWRHISAGLGQSILRASEDWRDVVVFPQLRADTREWHSAYLAIMKIVQSVKSELKMSAEHKPVLTGWGSGGGGALGLASKFGEAWSGVLVVDAPANVWRGTELMGCPLWAFYRESDIASREGAAKAAAALTGRGLASRGSSGPEAMGQSSSLIYGRRRVAEWMRQVSRDPVLAAVIQSPDKVSAMHLSLSRVHVADGQRGKTHYRIQCDLVGGNLQWKLNGYGSSRVDDGFEEGAIELADAWPLIGGWAALLQKSGLMATPTRVVPAEKMAIPVVMDEIVISVEIKGAAGSWSLQRMFPFRSRLDARYERTVNSVLSCEQLMVGELRRATNSARKR